ncbi:hypothetical protein G7K_6435-t1 [Saitoella complicata NRRL Y-17804]|uniref:RNA polymerase Rpb4/RPC9 core domain-containing protein n=2 Tax=Saitoella complicata (strain BCRC 22490 / CBS 7301 / JCM 7358 / NBRC 10748 / NRRL Y-17804) TaxID=698492 RepID=A0A0E9NR47_SAICN|nr:hypothetical protein G7K_6435-t1 [Saitoella complicata NRRL Y-17804]
MNPHNLQTRRRYADTAYTPSNSIEAYIMDSHRPTRQIRRGQEEEDAATLKLGAFNNVTALTVSEAKVILEQLQKDKKDATLNEIQQKTQDYVSLFSRFRTSEIVQAVDRVVRHPGNPYEPYEAAQLATLCCEEAEEAKYLIPSLAGKVEDEVLQQLLDELSSLRRV